MMAKETSGLSLLISREASVLPASHSMFVFTVAIHELLHYLFSIVLVISLSLPLYFAVQYLKTEINITSSCGRVYIKKCLSLSSRCPTRS